MSEEVEKYIINLPSPQKEIAEDLRILILTEFPNSEEKMKYGVPYYDDKFYIVGLKSSVNLGFSIRGLSKEEIALFQGKGKTTRHLKFENLIDIDHKQLKELLHLVGD